MAGVRWPGEISRCWCVFVVVLTSLTRAAVSIETFANILQNFLSLVHDCCGTFANCFDTERSHDYPGSVLIRPQVTGRHC